MGEGQRLRLKRSFGDLKVQSSGAVEDPFRHFPVYDGDGKVGENGVASKG